MKLIILCVIIMLSGCANIPSTIAPFPTPPAALMVAPPETLTITPTGASLSESVKIIVGNYTQYHLTKEQLKSLQNWVKEQQKVFESKGN